MRDLQISMPLFLERIALGTSKQAVRLGIYIYIYKEVGSQAAWIYRVEVVFTQLCIRTCLCVSVCPSDRVQG